MTIGFALRNALLTFTGVFSGRSFILSPSVSPSDGFDDLVVALEAEYPLEIFLLR